MKPTAKAVLAPKINLKPGSGPVFLNQKGY